MLIQCWCIVIIDDSFDDFDNFDVANKQKSNNIRVILIKSSQLDEEVLDTITKTVMSSNCWGRYELRREFIIKKKQRKWKNSPKTPIDSINCQSDNIFCLHASSQRSHVN